MTDHWYIATLIIRCRIEKKKPQKLFAFEERVCALRASSDENAYQKAVQLGRDSEHSYVGVHNQMVYWEFVGLEDLEQLDGAIRDGSEIRYRFRRSADPSRLANPKEKLSIFR